MDTYELKYTAEEIDGILESVDEKTIYGDATQSEHGLMSATDKAKIDSLPTSQQIDNSLSEKVDKEEGKGLSENDYTDAEKALVASAYQKPQNGIPSSDLDSSVRASLGKADTALQYYIESDPTVPKWAKEKEKPSYNYSEIGNTPDLSGYVTTSALNTALADYATTQDLQSYTPTSQLASVATSGSYNDLTNKPTIPAAQIQSDWSQSDNTAKDFIKNKPTIPTVPTNVSAFTNDAGYLTQHQSLTNYVQKSQTAGLLKNDGTVDTNTYLTQHQDISGKADKTLVASSMPSGGFLPNVVYNLGALSGNTTFSMAAATDNTIANIWCWTFTTPSTAPTITWPAAITGWSGGSQPTINASKSYEITVMNGLATIIES